MLRYGIPNYRFPKEVLDAEVDSIASLGIEVRYNVTVGRDVSLDELRGDYDAVYVAIGAHGDKKVNFGRRCPGVSAVTMLRASATATARLHR